MPKSQKTQEELDQLHNEKMDDLIKTCATDVVPIKVKQNTIFYFDNEHPEPQTVILVYDKKITNRMAKEFIENHTTIDLKRILTVTQTEHIYNTPNETFQSITELEQ